MENKNILSPTAARIYESWIKLGQAEAKRDYLGASIIGHECDMYLWLMFRNAVNESFDGRMYRLFDRGKREEAAFCADLRRIGCDVREFDDAGNQWSFASLGGHFGGHLDGLVKGVPDAPSKWHVVEFKTHSSDSFKKLCKEGVKKAKPMHYAQMQTYMGHVKLDDALYMAVNKDTDDLWCERVKFDKAEFDSVMTRAKHIIDTVNPDRCSSRPDDFRCKLCPCKAVCWHMSEQFIDPLVPFTCRTCCHATAITDGENHTWTCRLGHDCNNKVCADHLILPVFVKGDLVEGDERKIVYSFKDDKGEIEKVSIGPGGKLSQDEAKLIGPMTYKGAMMAKEAIGGTITNANTLSMKYSGDGFCEYFSGTVEELKSWIKLNPIADFSRPVKEEEFNGLKYFEYYNGVLVVIDGDKAQVISEDAPF